MRQALAHPAHKHPPRHGGSGAAVKVGKGGISVSGKNAAGDDLSANLGLGGLDLKIANESASSKLNVTYKDGKVQTSMTNTVKVGDTTITASVDQNGVSGSASGPFGDVSASAKLDKDGNMVGTFGGGVKTPAGRVGGQVDTKGTSKVSFTSHGATIAHESVPNGPDHTSIGNGLFHVDVDKIDDALGQLDDLAGIVDDKIKGAFGDDAADDRASAVWDGFKDSTGFGGGSGAAG